MGRQIGIDLGTAYTRISEDGKGIVLCAPSVISLKGKPEKVIAVGNEARKMIGRTPADITAIRPIRESLVGNIGYTGLLLGALFDRISATSVFKRPNVISTVPCGSNETEKRAVEDAVFEAGGATVDLVEAPIAAALGAGMKISSQSGGLVVDCGAGSVEVAVISHGGIVVASSVKTAGESMNDAIIRYLIDTKSIHIGEMTAEAIKHKIGTLGAATDRGSLNVSGKSTKYGGALTVSVSSAELREALLPCADIVVETITKALEATPPELSADISNYGILMSGGGSLLDGFPDYISDKLGMSVTRSKNPPNDVSNGLLQIIRSNGAMKRFIISSAR